MPMLMDRENQSESSLIHDIEQVTAATSHDLRDPLRDALDHCVALRQRGDRETEASIRHIEQSIEKVLVNVDALRQYTYFCLNSERPQALVLEELLLRAVNNCNPLLTLTNGRIHWPEEMAQITLWGRPRQLEALFTHLFDNGLKYNHAAVPEVHVAIEDMGNAYQFTVIDNGTGMEEEYAFLVFGLFKRVDPHGPVKGCGAGLAISQKVAENHGSTLHMQTGVDLGCRMTFTLPKTV